MGFLKDHQHTRITDIVVKTVTSDRVSVTTVLPTLTSLIEKGVDDDDYDDEDSRRYLDYDEDFMGSRSSRKQRNRRSHTTSQLTDYEYVQNQLECGRQIRKFFKYGKLPEKLKSLQLFNLIVSQDLHYTEMFNEPKLLKQLECLALGVNSGGSGSVPEYMDMKNVKKLMKVTKTYIMSWCSGNRDAKMFHGCYAGFFNLLAKLYKNSSSMSARGSSKKRQVSRNFMMDTADSSLHPDDVKYGIPVIIDIKKETPKIKILISDSMNCAVSLKNSLSQLKINERSVDNEQCTSWFIKTRDIRRKVLRYLQLIPDGEFLGALISTNDELVAALQKYDDLSGQSAGDSDLDGDSDLSDLSEELSESEPEEEEEELDSNNPFGDSNHL
ncbi:hypothetical protein ACO0QE_002269 [Hanseniaspora vineae]